MRNKVMTKDKFERELRAAAKTVTTEKMRAEKARINELNGNNPTKSYFMLKNGCFLMIHLIISVWF